MSFVRSVWCRVLISVGLLAWLVSHMDMVEAGRIISTIGRLHLVVALGLVVVDRALMLSRWVMLVRRSEPAVSVKSAVWVFLVGTYMGQLLPSGVGGDAARAYVLSRRTQRGVDAVALVMIDRGLGLCSLALLAATGLFVWSEQGNVELHRIGVVASVVAVFAVTGLFWADRIIGGVVPGAWLERGDMMWLVRLGTVIGRHRGHLAFVSSLLVLSILVQAVRVCQVYVLGRGLEIEVAFSYYMASMPIAILAILLPISIGGIGPAQGVIVWLLRPVGVPDEESFALSTLFVLAGLVGALPGAFLHLRSRIAEATR